MRWLLWPSTIRAAYLLCDGWTSGAEQLRRQAARIPAMRAVVRMMTVRRYHGCTIWATGRTNKRCDSFMPESRLPDTGRGLEVTLLGA